MRQLIRVCRVIMALVFVLIGVFGGLTERNESVVVIILSMLVLLAIAYGCLPKDLRETLKSRMIKGYRPVNKSAQVEQKASDHDQEEQANQELEDIVDLNRPQRDSLNECQFTQKISLFLKNNDYEEVKLLGNRQILGEKSQVAYLFYCQSSSQPVAVTAVHDVISSSRDYPERQLIVVTNDYFSEEAIAFASETDVMLWDREILSDLGET